MSTKKHNSFLHGFGSILALLPNERRTRYVYLYNGKDIRHITPEKVLGESWKEVGDALRSAMQGISDDSVATDEREQPTS